MKSKKKKSQKLPKQPIPLKDGDRVKLNVERIRGHPDFHSLVFEYKHWVLSNVETVFEITDEENHFGVTDMYLLKSDDKIHKWLLHSENLTKVKVTD